MVPQVGASFKNADMSLHMWVVEPPSRIQWNREWEVMGVALLEEFYGRDSSSESLCTASFVQSFPFFLYFLSVSSFFFFCCFFFWHGPFPSAPPPFDQHPEIQWPGLLQFVQ